jgi:menaquinone-specific isochorismate synthase
MTMQRMPSASLTLTRPDTLPQISGVGVTEQIVFDLGGGRLVRGVGPFRRMAQAPAGAWAFYVNDFSLSDAKPWLIPDHMEFACESGLERASTVATKWVEPEQEPFREVFRDIMGRIHIGELRKAVPAVVARGVWSDEATDQFLSALPRRPADAGTYAYAYREGEKGFGGRTPEVLFRVEEGVLKTMALAGTAPTARAAELLQNPKLLREHDLVVEVMRERLAALGELKIEPRRLMSLGVMTHLCTRLEVVLDDAKWESRGEELIRILHPTPALGIAPRTPETLALLKSYRNRLGVPEAFGAPIGVQWPGGLLVLVAIRGIFWQGNEACLPAGGGLVEGSEVEAEWAELELKRGWVRRALGV